MYQQNEITGVVLAGGLARRMGGLDKGLVLYQGKPLLAFALAAIRQVADCVLVNANRNHEKYRRLNAKVISDQTGDFAGPLAGVLAAMLCCRTEILLVMPCDTPRLTATHLRQLLQGLDGNTDIAVAFDGQRLQPVLLALRVELQNNLADFLQQGGRKIDRWLAKHRTARVDFSQQPDIFLNINTIDELEQLQQAAVLPQLSQSCCQSLQTVAVVDEFGRHRQIELVAEKPLTIYVDKREIVTLMTMGQHPEWLVLGYLKNQGFFADLGEIKSVQVDWTIAAAAVTSTCQNTDFSQQMQHRVVTSGCGQGTVFGRLLDKLTQVVQSPVKQSTIYGVLDALATHNQMYKKAGAVHACALCSAASVDFFTEDVGRHNAVDTIAGYMWLKNTNPSDKIFYTTGRLTSEMVIKVALMRIPVILSRSGATQAGLLMAQKTGVTLISRAKGKHFLLLNGASNVQFDAC